MCDKFYTLFIFKYIVFSLQTIKVALNWIDPFGTYMSGNANKNQRKNQDANAKIL